MESPETKNPKLKTRTRFSGTDTQGGKAGILIIEKITLQGELIVRLEIGLAEDEVRYLKDICARRLEGDKIS